MNKVPRIKREQYLKLQSKSALRYLAALVLICFLFLTLGLGTTFLSTPEMKLPIWIINGFMVSCLFQLWHETWHLNAFHHKFPNTLLGHILAVFFIVSYDSARFEHLYHHRYNRTSKDPGAYDIGKRGPYLWFRYYSVAFLAIPSYFVYFNFVSPLLFYRKKKLIHHLLLLTLATVLYGFIAYSIFNFGVWPWIRDLWVMPLLFSSPWIGFKSVADHHGNEWNGNPARMANTTYSSPLLTYLWYGHNFHIEHHLFPRIPGFNLPKAHQFIRQDLEALNAPIFKSFLRLVWRCISKGPDIANVETVYTHLRRAPF